MLNARKEKVGGFLNAIKLVKRMKIENLSDFGEQYHTPGSEPYFYDESYQFVKRGFAIPVDGKGKCYVHEYTNKKPNEGGPCLKWKCTPECRPLSQHEVDSIIDLRRAFDLPTSDFINELLSCDKGCPNGHYYDRKVVNEPDDPDPCYVVHLVLTPRLGHSIVCANDGGCSSKLRILRAASTHYPLLRTFLSKVAPHLELGHKTKSILDLGR